MLFLLQSVKHCMKVLSGPNVSLVEGFVGNNRIAVIFSEDIYWECILF